MNRRTLIKQLALMGFSAVPLKSLLASTITSHPGKRSFHAFRLGALELNVVTDGHIVTQPVQPSFAPGIAAEKVADALQRSFRPTEEIDLAVNILVIKKGTDIILIDTGAGAAFGNNTGWLVRSLADAGIKPKQVTAVVITHAHPDHIGGLIDDRGALVFPNAPVYMAGLEHGFWTSASPDFSRSKFTDRVLLETILAGTRKTLLALGGNLRLVKPDDELFGCIRFELAAGHTPGHMLVHIFSGNETLVHVADLVHSDVLLFPHPEWGYFGDTDFALAAATRERVLRTLAEQRRRVFSSHLPWPGLGHVRKENQGYSWVAETYSFPD
jgi:glyoxylase-like metal-dependent hydrolase (beta-lactamase superfamily II)